MKTAKKFLKAKGLKDTLYNVNYNPNQNRGLPEKEWTKGGLSALLDEYAEWKVKNLSSNPVLSNSLPLAVEFGYKQCEKGNNIQMALIEFNKVIGNV